MRFSIPFIVIVWLLVLCRGCSSFGSHFLCNLQTFKCFSFRIFCGILVAITSSKWTWGLFPLCPSMCLFDIPWARQMRWEKSWPRYSSLAKTFFNSSVFTSFFGRGHIHFFVAKLATAVLVKGTHLFCSKKIKIKLGKAFLFPNLFRAAAGLFFVGIPLSYATFSCLAVIRTVKFKY